MSPREANGLLWERAHRSRLPGFTDSIELEHLGGRQSPFATFIDYRVNRST